MSYRELVEDDNETTPLLLEKQQRKRNLSLTLVLALFYVALCLVYLFRALTYSRLP